MSERAKSNSKTVTMTRGIRHFLAALFAVCVFAMPAYAAESPAGEEVTLIVQDGWTDWGKLFGLRMKMKPGWHTYWRAPGDSGLAPTFDWSDSKNVASVKFLWPVPKRFDAEGDTTFGYESEVIWPVFVHPIDKGKPIVLDLKISYGVCKNICVPNEVRVSMTVVPVSLEVTPFAGGDGALIRSFLIRVPHAPRPPVAVTAKLVGEELRVTLSNASEVPAIIPEGPRGVWFGKPETSQRGKNVIYKMPLEIEKGHALKGSDLVLTFSGPKTAIEAKVKVE